jgi:predicted murein hydrolase (TIGR00659 family)
MTAAPLAALGRAPPIAWLALTLLLFEAADLLSRRSGRHPLLHPVLLSAPVLMALLGLSGMAYKDYAADTGVLAFLLGPATVALAVPLWRHRAVVRKVARPLAAALLAGSLTAIVSAVGIAWLLGAPPTVLASVAPRACTTPVAMAVAAQLGGLPSLAAAVVLLTGVVGAMVATPLLDALRIVDPKARGLAAGVAAHGFGTARAFQVSEIRGVFASIGLALNAGLTALILSLSHVLR